MIVPERPRLEGAQQDDDGFASWYVEVWPRLVGFLLVQTRDRQEAEDLAAETMARSLARWGTGDVERPTAWAFTVAMNLSRRSFRRQVRDRAAAQRWATRDWVAEPDVRDPDLLVALAGLPRRQRLAVGLFYLADLTQAEVARSMGISPGTAAALLHQARTRLRRQLGGEP